jgi:hypothetical protein
MAREFDSNPEKEKFITEVESKAIAFFLKQYVENIRPGKITGGKACEVTYLDRRGGYFLVPVYLDKGLIGVVQIGETGHEVESSALIKDPSSTFLMGFDEAVNLAKERFPHIKEFRQPYLGWKPCRESFNSLNPLWVLPHPDGFVYITQAGSVSETLSGNRGG